MPTERLYYADSYLRQFSAHVTDRTDWNGRPAVALDRSAFYPEGGGQPGDHGQLNGIAVLDTQVRDGVVWHIIERAINDDAVDGEIDWTRRFDHMQQHHGQHLLSAAFVHCCDLPTVSFHLGAESCTIDLQTSGLSDDQVEQALMLANSIVWQDRSIDARFVTPEEAARLPLRKAPSVVGSVRVVSVPEFDYSACGGTHPRSTGSVGMIVVRSWSRQKSGTRVEFVCGGRALADYGWINGIARRLAASESVGLDQLEAALERLRSNEATNRRALEDARARLLQYEAQELLANATRIGTARVVRQRFDGRSAAELRALAERIAAHPDGVALLGAADTKAQIIVARGAAVPIDAGALVRTALPLIGGRGGGQASLAQGGGPDVAQLDTALDAMAALIGQQLVSS
jgi:alanyl-tRNA synthetase